MSKLQNRLQNKPLLRFIFFTWWIPAAISTFFFVTNFGAPFFFIGVGLAGISILLFLYLYRCGVLSEAQEMLASHYRRRLENGSGGGNPLENLRSDQPIQVGDLFRCDQLTAWSLIYKWDVILEGKKTRLDTDVCVLGSNKRTADILGHIIVTGFGDVVGVRKVNQNSKGKNWVVTSFSDHSQAIANSKTNEIACTCKATSCKHKLVALINAHLNTNQKWAKKSTAQAKKDLVKSLSLYAITNGADYKGLFEKNKRHISSSIVDTKMCLTYLIQTRRLLRDYLEGYGKPIILDSSKADQQLTVYTEGIEAGMKADRVAYRKALRQEKLEF